MVKKAAKKSMASSYGKNLIRPGYRLVMVIFGVLAFVVVVIILYFALSKATIAIQPIYQNQQADFAVQIIDQNALAPENAPTDRLPGFITDTLVEATQEFTASKVSEISIKAGGEVIIYNHYSQNQPLIATTRFLTSDGKLYRLVKGVTVPAGGEIKAQVLADSESDQFIIGPAKLTIPGLWSGLQDKIYAQGQGFTKQTTEKFIVKQSDIDNAVNQLKQQLTDQAIAEIKQSLEPTQTINPGNLSIAIVKSNISAKPNDETEKFTITLGLGVKAVIFDQDRLKQLAFQTLPDIYRQNQSIVNIDENSLTYSLTLFDKNSENLLAQVKGNYALTVATVKIDKNALQGLKKEEAEKYLMSLGNIEKVEIKLPFWTNYLPTLTDNINIIIN